MHKLLILLCALGATSSTVALLTVAGGFPTPEVATQAAHAATARYHNPVYTYGVERRWQNKH